MSLTKRPHRALCIKQMHKGIELALRFRRYFHLANVQYGGNLSQISQILYRQLPSLGC